MERSWSYTFTLLFLVILCSQDTVASSNCPQRALKHFSRGYRSPTRTEVSRISFKRIIVSILLGVLIGLTSAVIFAFIVRFFIKYVKQTQILKGPVIFSPKISPRTLHTALAGETQLLGSSPNGNYYKTVLDNGLVIAVKRLDPFEHGLPDMNSKSGKRNIQQELEILAGLRHRNLMSLRAYVLEPDRISLVYDYAPNGSLEDAMKRVRENQLELAWEARLKIAVGVVKGLQFLHFTCVPQIMHYNLKPTNVILDSEFEPRLADCGLAKLIPHMDRAASVYRAPENFHGNRYTDKSDIFSFGIILGVLLTGRDPSDPFFRGAANGGSLGKWLKHMEQAGEAREALDKSLLDEEVEEDEIVMAVRIAIICLSDLPADRPSSDELVHLLTQLHSF